MFVTKPVRRKVAPVTGFDWIHLWRMVDAVADIAPDTGTPGGADFSLVGTTVVADGVQINGGSSRCMTDLDNLFIDLRDDVTYTYVFDGLAIAEGFPGKGFGRFYDASITNTTIEMWLHDSENGINLRNIRSGVGLHSIDYGGNTYPQKMTFIIPRTSGQSTGTIYCYRDGVRIIKYTSADIAEASWANPGASFLYIGNRTQGLERPWNNLIRWAGILDKHVSDAEADAIAANDRPT